MKTILFQGDSITDCSRSRDREDNRGCGYATLVSARLMHDHPGEYRCVNRGVSGNRVPDVLARMRCDIEQVHPDVMSLLIGVNDVWHEISGGNGVNSQRYERLLDVLLDEIRMSLPNIRLMVLEPFVLEGSATCNTEEKPHRLETFRAEVTLRAQAARRVAQKHGALFIPLQEELNERAARSGAGTWLIDGVHPTAAGHMMIAEKWLDAYRQLDV